MSLLKTFRHLFHPQRSNNHRARILHPEALIILTVALAGFWVSLTPSSPVNFLLAKGGAVLGYASDITASEVVQQTNVERQKQGLGVLTVNDKLNQAALAKAQNMFQEQYWAHVAPDGTQPWKFFQDAGYQYSVAGENLARDFSDTPNMMAAWMASPTHRANILDGRYKEIGVAVMDGKLLGTDTTLVVQLFGTPPLGGAPQISSQADQTSQRLTFVQSAPQAGGLPVNSKNSQNPAGSNNPTNPNTPNNPDDTDPNGGPAVLASVILPITSLNSPILFSPLQLVKAVFLAVILVVALTLIYDSFIMSRRRSIRLVGKNFAHIMLLAVVAFLVIFFKGGIVGSGISF